MSTKLYPPYIEGTLAPFTINSAGGNIQVPLILNRAVSMDEVSQYRIKIKNIYSNAYIYTNTVINNHTTTPTFDITAVDSALFKPGQFYKVQVACIDENNIEGYYSTVGVIKCTNSAQIGINIDNSQYTYSYMGYYANADSTEKPYYYKFSLLDANGVILETSGDQIHLSENSNNTIHYDNYTFHYDLLSTANYIIKYDVTTINGLQMTTSASIIQTTPLVNLKGKLYTVMNFENGYVNVILDTQGSNYNGNYVLVRAEKNIETEEYKIWNPMLKICFDNESQGGLLFKDFTVEQGKFYKYGLYKESAAGLRSARLETLQDTIPDFEDMFLYDGERQLKIKFNPQVSSFKINILENKTETIGGKYPFFFRNGRVEYKEFPIAGLLSYHTDEEALFCTDSFLGLNQDFEQRVGTAANTFKNLKLRTVNLVDYNFTAERKFKLSVLDWLNDGKPKLFRSPTEGNYLVRLMNTSLSPEQQLSRLLHSFSTTAYEIGPADYLTLSSDDYQIIQVPTIEVSNFSIKTYTPQDLIDLVTLYNDTNLFSNFETVYGFWIDATTPGAEFTVQLKNSNTNIKIVAPETTFGIQPSEGLQFSSLEFNIPSLKARDVSLTIIYKSKDSATDEFSNLTNETKDVIWPCYELTTGSFNIQSLNSVYTQADYTQITYPSFIKRIFVRKAAKNVLDTTITLTIKDKILTFDLSDNCILDINLPIDSTTNIPVPEGYIFNISYVTQLVKHTNNKWKVR